MSLVMKLIDGIVYLELADAEKCGIGNPDYIRNENSRGAKWGVFVTNPVNKNELLIEYHSLSKTHSLKVLDYFGDPVDYLIKQPIRSLVIRDSAAEKFYREFRDDNRAHLPQDIINVYTIAASWLNMLLQTTVNKKRIKKLLNISITEFYVHVTEIIEQDQIELPFDIIALKKTIDSYKSEGYGTLVPKTVTIQDNKLPNERPINPFLKNPEKNLIKIALIDDHILVRNALSVVIDSFEECVIINQSANGQEMINAFLAGIVPDIVILDLLMPVMDGFETADWLHKNFPKVHILMLTMYDSELSLIRLLQKGIKGFIKKNSPTAELKFAILSIMQSGFYYSHHITGKLVNLFYSGKKDDIPLQKTILSDQEIEFLKLSCSDLTYKEIAKAMNLNVRSIDSLRNNLFVKLDVRSRVGLAMMAIRNGLAPTLLIEEA
jgi:two-component system, NarL family, invasion response regulator UvrY